MTASGFGLGGGDAGNYQLSGQPSGLAADIAKAGLTVTADDKAKAYGGTDPALTYATSGLQGSDSAGSILSGALTRDAGENAGTYNITQGTLASNSNYTIAYTARTSPSTRRR